LRPPELVGGHIHFAETIRFRAKGIHWSSLLTPESIIGNRAAKLASQRLDVVLVGSGIMSVTLAVILKEQDASLKIAIYEVLGGEAEKSSNAWNNARTGHAALSELN